MYKSKHESKLNFNYILEECKKRYRPFNKPVEKNRNPKSLITAINDAKKSGRNPIIAEIKYRSPTTTNKADVYQRSTKEIALDMIKGGACAISVLTEPEFFGGSLDNLSEVKSVSMDLPVLRKDFIFHPTQIPESYYYGADSVLLISSFHTERKLKRLIELCRFYGMEPLVEVHGIEDINRATDSGAKLFAINNRDKDTLKIDLSRTAEMAPHIKGVKVSASGIENRPQLKVVLSSVEAALIGSSIMTADDIASKVAEFVRK